MPDRNIWKLQSPKREEKYGQDPGLQTIHHNRKIIQ